MVVFMMAILFIAYICMGAWLITADSLTITRYNRQIYHNDLSFFGAVLLWPLVFALARWKWHQK